MNRYFGIVAAHRAHGNVVAHTAVQRSVELTVDERVEVAAVAAVTKMHHAGGNTASLPGLPEE